MTFFYKLFFLKINFQDEAKLYAICLFYILTVYRKCLPSQFVSRCIGIHIFIVTGGQNG